MEKEICLSLSLYRGTDESIPPPLAESRWLLSESERSQGWPRTSEEGVVAGGQSDLVGKRSRCDSSERLRAGRRESSGSRDARVTHTHPRVDEACGTRGHGRGGRALAEPPLDVLARERIAIRASEVYVGCLARVEADFTRK